MISRRPLYQYSLQTKVITDCGRLYFHFVCQSPLLGGTPAGGGYPLLGGTPARFRCGGIPPARLTMLHITGKKFLLHECKRHTDHGISSTPIFCPVTGGGGGILGGTPSLAGGVPHPWPGGTLPSGPGWGTLRSGIPCVFQYMYILFHKRFHWFKQSNNSPYPIFLFVRVCGVLDLESKSHP